jgi:hypothetical protein
LLVLLSRLAHFSYKALASLRHYSPVQDISEHFLMI